MIPMIPKIIKLPRIIAPDWEYNDGGRKKAGYRGKTNDCICRAISIALELPYQTVYEDLNMLSKPLRSNGFKASARVGVPRKIYQPYLEDLGWEWIALTGRGTGFTHHLRNGEIPPGRIICRISGHLTAVINGIINDTYDPSRMGNRGIYGYFRKVV